MFSAGVTVRCPCRWRNIEDISKWSRALMLVCWFASVPSSPKRKGLHAKMRHNFPANVTRWIQKTKMLKSKYIKKNTSYNWQSVVVRVRVALKRTVVGDWRFDNLSKTHLWIWKWLPLRLSKGQSPKKALFRNTLTQTITLYELYILLVQTIYSTSYAERNSKETLKCLVHLYNEIRFVFSFLLE